VNSEEKANTAASSKNCSKMQKRVTFWTVSIKDYWY